MTRWIRSMPIVAVLAACGAVGAEKPVVANRGKPNEAKRSPNACPTQTLSGWEHEVWPACPTLPFRYDFDVCNGGRCPEPCRVEVDEPKRGAPVTADATYDTRGRLTTMTPLAGEYVFNMRCTYVGDRMTECGGDQLAYDERGRVTMVTEPSLQKSGLGPRSYAYDERGRVGSMSIASKDEDAHRYVYRYDDRGRLIALDYEASGIHEHTSYRYGNDGRLAETDNGYVTFHYGYDALGRVVSVKDDRGEVALTYDNLGRLVREATREDPAERPRIHTYVYNCH